MRDDIELLGASSTASGSSGEVWKGANSSNEFVAVKMLRIYERSDIKKLMKVAPRPVFSSIAAVLFSIMTS